MQVLVTGAAGYIGSHAIRALGRAGYEVIDVHARVFAWPGRLTVAAYGRLPFWMFRAICYWYGTLTGQGWEVLATCRPLPPAGARS